MTINLSVMFYRCVHVEFTQYSPEQENKLKLYVLSQNRECCIGLSYKIYITILNSCFGLISIIW